MNCQTDNLAHFEAMAEKDLGKIIETMARKARAASLVLGVSSTRQRNEALGFLAELIRSRAADLKTANAKDIEFARNADLSESMIDRLILNDSRIEGMAQGVEQVAELDDPVGTILDSTTRPNDLRIDKVRVPIGVIGIIYESRPNVTIDCAVLCLKSGNAAILRGGKEAFHSNTFLAGLIQEALGKAGIQESAVQLVPTTDRAALNHLLELDEYVHCIIPRGGEKLIRFVSENTRIPVIKHYLGVCAAYVDKDADFKMAVDIVVNAKVQRPSACNAIENLFIHADIAKDFLPKVASALQYHDVELRVDGAAVAILLRASGVTFEPAEQNDLFTEHLDKIITVKVVNSIDEAIQSINRYGSAHSDTIITDSSDAAEKFMNGVDSATVYWNASTRFTDGFEFGLGAEIGISTDRLHARGPMGLNELCTYKFKITGTGQIRP
ncbi:MAG: glutamate-5-semialdehyde dehydrogenase [Opitutales bacterium]